MDVGKTASQAGHAYLGAFLEADDDVRKAYHSDGIGTKVCLACNDLDDLNDIYNEAQKLGLPRTIIHDSGNNTCFNGVTTTTAVGIGPITKDQAPFLKNLKLHH